MNPTLEPFHRAGKTKFLVGIEGANRQLIFSADELEALRVLIVRAQECCHAGTG